MSRWLATGLMVLGLAAASRPLFRDAADESGLRFRHFTGSTGEYFMPEIMGAGGALFDYDGDGDLDVYLVQGTMLDPQRSPAASPYPRAPGQTPGHRLFRNDLRRGASGRLEAHFTDVTEQAGLAHVGYGMGVAVGDYDNDGHPDLYLTSFGPNVLYHNNGNGTFTDVTATAGVDDPRWSTSASYCDYDKDGRLDLYVANYLAFTVAGNKACFESMGGRDYCNPSAYRPLPDRLFHNEGGGRFKDVSEAAGITRAFGPGLGVACADFNGDGWPDFYVANDGAPNQLWINRADGTFEDQGLLSGTAYNADGLPQGSMGLAVADFDGDGDEDILVTNLPREGNALYVNDGKGHFQDFTEAWGLKAPSLRTTGFGTGWFDYDNDGRLDLFVANGAVNLVQALRGSPYPFQERNLVFHNPGRAPLEPVEGALGPELPEVSRGAVFGDVNEDGGIDVLITNNNGPARLLLNEVGTRGHWLQVGLRGVEDNSFGQGARVALLRRGVPPLWRRAHTDGSYLSARDVRVHFGLGASAELERVLVIWPKGRAESWSDLRADRTVELRQGTGQPWTGPLP